MHDEPIFFTPPFKKGMPTRLYKGGGLFGGGVLGAIVGGLIGGPMGAALGAGIGASSGAQADAAQAQADAAKKATQQAQANADKQAAQADQAFNQANQKRPDTSAILSAAQQAGKAGASGTMLTGPQGVDPNALNLGKNTLLGQ